MARSGYTRHDGELIVRYGERDVLEIMDTRTTDQYGFF